MRRPSRPSIRLHGLPPVGDAPTRLSLRVAARAMPSSVSTGTIWPASSAPVTGDAQTQVPSTRLDRPLFARRPTWRMAGAWTIRRCLPRSFASRPILTDSSPSCSRLFPRTETGHRQRRRLARMITGLRPLRWSPDPTAIFNSEQVAYTVSEFARDRDVTFARLSFGWPRSACRFRSPLDFLGKDGGGTVGTGPGHSVGAALALRDSGRLTMGVIGDGDYLMGVNALWTASSLDLPMMLLIVNNRSYFNDEIHQERMAVAAGQDRSPTNGSASGWIIRRRTLSALRARRDFEGDCPGHVGRGTLSQNWRRARRSSRPAVATSSMRSSFPDIPTNDRASRDRGWSSDETHRWLRRI